MYIYVALDSFFLSWWWLHSSVMRWCGECYTDLCSCYTRSCECAPHHLLLHVIFGVRFVTHCHGAVSTLLWSATTFRPTPDIPRQAPLWSRYTTMRCLLPWSNMIQMRWDTLPAALILYQQDEMRYAACCLDPIWSRWDEIRRLLPWSSVIKMRWDALPTPCPGW